MENGSGGLAKAKTKNIGKRIVKARGKKMRQMSPKGFIPLVDYCRKHSLNANALRQKVLLGSGYKRVGQFIYLPDVPLPVDWECYRVFSNITKETP